MHIPVSPLHLVTCPLRHIATGHWLVCHLYLRPIQHAVLFVAYVYNPHATAFAAPTPFADTVTAMSCVVVLHSISVKQSSMAIPFAHGSGMAQNITKQWAVPTQKPLTQTLSQPCYKSQKVSVCS